MEIQVFGKHGCARCESTKKKVAFFLRKWDLVNDVQMTFFDMETVDGRAEGAFNDVVSVPTTILCRDGASVARWDGAVPDSEQLRLGIHGGPPA